MSKEIKRQNRSHVIKPVYLVLFILGLLYGLLLYRDAAILKPSGGGRSELFIISITIAIPELLIWAIAFLSSLKLKSYAKTISSSKDGPAMTYMADGLMLMSVYIVLLCTSENVITLFKNTDNMHKIILIENYVPLVIALISTILLVLSALRLNKLAPFELPKKTVAISAGLFIVFVGLLTWHLYRVHPREFDNDHVHRFIFHHGVLFSTYLLPQIILWALGLLACLSIANYAIHVKGTIYKALLKNLYKGVLIVYLCIFLAQVFILTNFTLDKFSVILLLIYCLLLLGAYGFVLIYKGTSSLNKLEKI